MNAILKNNADIISELCEEHKVKELYAFGSVLNSNFNEESDIDLMVNFLPQDVIEYADNYYDLKFELQKIFKRDIDLLEEKAIKNPYFKRIISENKHLIYGYSG
ncbi:MAG: nucleotidyltransferase domain-containing protein [Weeksellaceae bacterium]|nr:nucleotidyltransferase domain-containing protein [Weeksellaceae bacterium]